ncbi:MAG: hypothetical protein AVDCRST_MAG53-2603, partial [uncultured Solirubrobacteraceae bacterium]
ERTRARRRHRRRRGGRRRPPGPLGRGTSERAAAPADRARIGPAAGAQGPCRAGRRRRGDGLRRGRGDRRGRARGGQAARGQGGLQAPAQGRAARAGHPLLPRRRSPARRQGL